MGELTAPQRQILVRMAAEPGEGALTATWIAEGCGHYYDAPWASSKLPALIKRGLVQKLSRGWYAITNAGRLALKDNDDAR